MEELVVHGNSFRFRKSNFSNEVQIDFNEPFVKHVWQIGLEPFYVAVADPGFPVGVGRGLPRRLRFENFVCLNERIWTLEGRAPGTPPRSANA